MIYNIGRVQRNGLKIVESEVNDTVNPPIFWISAYLGIIFLQYFIIYKVYIKSHSHVLISIYQTKTIPKSHRIHIYNKGN
jgi:hypothetical protein